jgi:hypothetical protein
VRAEVSLFTSSDNGLDRIFNDVLIQQIDILLQNHHEISSDGFEVEGVKASYCSIELTVAAAKHADVELIGKRNIVDPFYSQTRHATWPIFHQKGAGTV